MPADMRGVHQHTLTSIYTSKARYDQWMRSLASVMYAIVTFMQVIANGHELSKDLGPFG